MTLFSSQPGDEGLPGPARARVMAAIMTTTLMGVFDGTMINIALPSMAQEMQVPAGIAVWFANGYLLAAAMTLAIFAALLLGSTIMAANSLQNATYQFGSLCWMALAALSGMAFIWQIRRTGHPLLPPTMFKNERFTLAAFTSMIAFVSQGITFIALPFLFQSEYGYSPVVSALLFTPWPLGIVLIAPHAGRWADTISAPAISTLGLVIFVVGLILLATLPASPSMWDICLRSLVCGIGFGCFQSPNNREMLSNVIREHASYASGVLSIMRTFGQCLGAAAVAVLLAADERAIHVALWSAAAASAVSVVVSASRLRKITHPAETG
ncbi:TPA: MFS transporter [Klebsiella quasipneumoniae]|nr:MFS transporter [Klebsiella quasipneumoniae subsp. similipneumoniae]HDS3414031.1 MFS transporter [Klebsiella quasipneumoniae]